MLRLSISQFREFTRREAPHHLPIFITAPGETDVLIAVADQDAGAERSLIEVQGKSQ